MAIRSRLAWSMMALLSPCMVARLAAGTPTPTVSPSPSPTSEHDRPSSPGLVAKQVKGSNYFQAAVTLFYDSDKVVGIFPEFPGTGPNSFVEYQFPGESVVRIEGQLSFGNSTQVPRGTPFAFHCYSDWFGHLRGFERVRANPSPVYFVIPVSASALGVEPLVQNFIGIPPGGHGTSVGTSEDVLIGDSNTFPTAALAAPSLPGMENLIPSIHAEYLSGNGASDSQKRSVKVRTPGM